MALISNKKAAFNFKLQKKFEAGIELYGYEVKSLRAGQGSLLGAHVIVRGGEGYLINADIPAFQPANAPDDYNPTRPRKLLLSKKELAELESADSQKRLTVVPISVYNKGRKLKLEIAIAHGKKEYDKRETIKKRDTERDLGRSLKNR